MTGYQNPLPERRAQVRRWTIFALVIAVLSLFVAARLLFFRHADASPLLTGLPHEILSASGVYFLGSDSTYSHSAAYAMTTSEGIIVVDPGIHFSMLEAAFAHLGLAMSDVRIILVTHRHADHWFAARKLVDRSGAIVMAHADEVSVLTEAADLGQYYSSYPPIITDVPVLSSVRPLKDGDRVQLGKREIEVIAAPGHTPGSACYRTEINGRRILWTGDTVLGLTPESFGGDYMTRIGPRYGGDMPSYLATLRRLRSIPVDIVLPGHPVYGSKLDCRVGVDGWMNLLDPLIRKLDRWLTQFPTETTLFLDGVAKPLGAEVIYLGDAASTASYVLQTTEGSICVDPGRRTIEEIGSVMSKHGANLDAIRVVLITTMHPDHFESASELCVVSRAKLFTPPVPAGFSDTIRADRVLAEGDEFEVGETKITAFDSGAGAMSYLVVTAMNVILIGGDNLARFPLAPDEEYHRNTRLPDAQKEAAFYRRLKRLRVQIVLPAHPRYDEAPFYLPGEWEHRTSDF